ncbi:hypothetical protein [Limosilactobacillus antri]|uniref:Uncharacterized protein n=1 Tax=Limosilactobacillus antri DSM 16041 TaxID=525309 RepID=C8P5K6_9LACO|nr:hypothetical protein [Limosilactobacillus antri]EEW54177.1 hypothetical protein HMPREF0494_0598 [Limosilactobacillus antri DSM 16041]KRK60037.1 hypothetical protein FC31_GL002118 [Limosilactobacillus antri DSM 16041]
MKMTVADYLGQITGNRVVKEVVTKTAAQAQQKTTLKTAIQFMLDQFDKGYLGQYNIDVKMKTGDPVSVRLEANLINIPMAEAERLDGKLLDQGPEYPVNLYMVMESADVNKSGLRIDELANDTDQGGSLSTLVERAQEWLAEHLAVVAEARA